MKMLSRIKFRLEIGHFCNITITNIALNSLCISLLYALDPLKNRSPRLSHRSQPSLQLFIFPRTVPHILVLFSRWSSLLCLRAKLPTLTFPIPASFNRYLK